MKHSTTGSRNYQQFDRGDPEDNDSVLVHIVPENKSRWNHIEDLDSFFTRIYNYHQQHGFTCMVLNESLQLLQFAFICFFTAFLAKCVNYQILFNDVPKVNNGTKVTLSDVVVSPGECVSNFSPTLWIFLIIAFIFWVLRFVGAMYHFFQHLEIRNFYKSALQIDDNNLNNLTWNEIQQRLRIAQQEFQMCIHKSDLTELDIYHRILRFKNYMVAFINKSILPLKFDVPFFGETIFLSRSLKYNIEFLLFWGPWAPFDSNWHLREEYKQPNRRRELSQHLSKFIGYVGIVNLILAPLILLWQVLYAFFSYAEIIKREPGSLGTRRWSLYGRLNLRHFNELDHELQARLCRAYHPATLYLSGFPSNVVAVLARNIAFLAGSILAVLVLLTVYDEDVITVEHVLTIMTALGAIVALCRVLIPEENLVWCPESLMEAILAQVHYLPMQWKGKAHTSDVRLGLAKIFQFKAVYLFEELISPLVTPFILYFALRPKALEIVDFLRQFTVEVVGVGDVCSFAQLDLQKHGQPQWQSVINSQTEENSSLSQDEELYNDDVNNKDTEDGKTELSLVHFALTNPEWRPPEKSEGFLAALRSQIQQEFPTNPLIHRSIIVSSAGTNPSMLHCPPILQDVHSKSYFLLGSGIAKSEGPRNFPQNRSFIGSRESSLENFGNNGSTWNSSEPVAVNMSVSTLFLHDLQHRRTQQLTRRNMPDIRETPDEDDYTNNPTAVATAALTAAVQQLSNNSRLAKST